MDPATWGQIWALLSAVSWAVAVVFFKKCGAVVPPLSLNLFKDVLSLAAFVPLALLVEGTLLPDRPGREWGLVLLSGLLGITAADTLFFIALNRLGAGLNAILDCLYAPLMIAQAALFLGESLAPIALAGGALIVLGIAIGSLRRGASARPPRDIVIGVALGTLGLVCVTSSVVIIKPFLAKERIFWTVTWRLLFGTLPLLPLALRIDGRAALGRAFRPSRLWRLIVPGSVFGSLLAMAAWIAGFTLHQVAAASILNQLSTIFIFLLAAAFLGERLTPRRSLAVALAFTGAILAWLG